MVPLHVVALHALAETKAEPSTRPATFALIAYDAVSLAVLLFHASVAVVSVVDATWSPVGTGGGVVSGDGTSVASGRLRAVETPATFVSAIWRTCGPVGRLLIVAKHSKPNSQYAGGGGL